MFVENLPTDYADSTDSVFIIQLIGEICEICG